MLTIFNRKELFVTFSMEKQSKIKTILSDNHIKYDLKVVNRTSPSATSGTRTRTNMGTFGQNLNQTYEYIFYVHKNDFEQAQYLINQ